MSDIMMAYERSWLQAFKLYSYTNTDKERKNMSFGDISILFKEDKVILRDGCEHDYDGFTLSEIEDYYAIAAADYQKIISLIITDEYKNESVLKEYRDAHEYYEKLSKQEEKLLFIFFLNYFKTASRVDNFIKILKDNGINYIYASSHYP
jgi:hypothetical protein